MPRAPRKCPHEGCEARITSGRYCPEHTEPWQGSSRNTDDHEWKALSRSIRARDKGVCWICRTRGADATDHLRPKAYGGTDQPANLAAIHDRVWPHCHRPKTALDRTAMDRRYTPQQYQDAIAQLQADLSRKITRSTTPTPPPPRAA
jgi:5-methylcytosine-specific restriction enzyme A